MLLIGLALLLGVLLWMRYDRRPAERGAALLLDIVLVLAAFATLVELILIICQQFGIPVWRWQ